MIVHNIIKLLNTGFFRNSHKTAYLESNYAYHSYESLNFNEDFQVMRYRFFPVPCEQDNFLDKRICKKKKETLYLFQTFIVFVLGATVPKKPDQ